MMAVATMPRTVAQIEDDMRLASGTLMVAREFRNINEWAMRDYREAQKTLASLQRELAAARRRQH